MCHRLPSEPFMAKGIEEGNRTFLFPLLMVFFEQNRG